MVQDNWIPDLPSSIISTISSLDENQMVNSLMKENELFWNEDMVSDLFYEEIAGRILSVTISSSGCTKFSSWPHTKSGIYSVRFAYNMAR